MSCTYEEMRSTLASDNLSNVLEDLKEFTGLSEEEILKRVMRKPKTLEISASGWFDEEYAFYKPVSEAELRWFYLTSQSYLFSNSRKGPWLPVFELTEKDQPILDYGAGIGINVLFLTKRNIKCWYFEIGYLQTLFFQHRMMKRGLSCDFLPVKTDWKEFSNGYFKTIILQDVLEHIPNYETLLVNLISSLQRGGKIIEESPFMKRGWGGLAPKKMHLPDKVGLHKLMNREGMVLEKTNFHTVRYWRKDK